MNSQTTMREKENTECESPCVKSKTYRLMC